MKYKLLQKKIIDRISIPLTISSWILIAAYIFIVKNPIEEVTIGDQIISIFLGLFVIAGLSYFISIMIAKLIILSKKRKGKQ